MRSSLTGLENSIFQWSRVEKQALVFLAQFLNVVLVLQQRLCLPGNGRLVLRGGLRVVLALLGQCLHLARQCVVCVGQFQAFGFVQGTGGGEGVHFALCLAQCLLQRQHLALVPLLRLFLPERCLGGFLGVLGHDVFQPCLLKKSTKKVKLFQ